MVIPSPETKNRSFDRVLEVAPIEGKTPKDSSGMLDKRLFTGGNALHIKMDPETCLWFMYYEQGNVPPALRGRFTSFTAAQRFAQDYYKTRDVEVKKVID